MSRSIHDPRHDLPLHDDVLTPMHHHVEGRNFLMAHDENGVRAVSGPEAVAIAQARRALPVSEVDHVSDGPRKVTRRALLGTGAGVGLGALLLKHTQPRMVFAATPKGRDLVVVVFLRGGFDGLSAVVPVTDQAYYAARPDIGVRAEETWQLNNQFSANKNLQALSPLWKAGQAAVVVGAGSSAITRSHFDDQISCELAAPASMRSGWLGRHLATSSAEYGTFRAISVGNQVAVSLTTTAFNTVAMSGVDEFNIDVWGDDRPGFLSSLESMYGRSGGVGAEQSRTLLKAVDELASVRDTAYAPAAGVSYPDHAFGRGLRDIARVAKSRVGLEVATVDFNDWDMHAKLGKASVADDWFARQSRILAQSIAAFATDLGSVWNTTTVVLMSEFGRRVAQNGDNGADHGHGNTLWLFGGGINGGVYGTQPSLTPDSLVEGDVPVTTDYRTVLAEVVSKRLGNAKLAEVFPGWEAKPFLGVAKGR